jgi:hypothetical protein
MLLATPLAGFAQYAPMYGAYPRPVAPYGYPNGFPMYGNPALMQFPGGGVPAPTQPIPGYDGSRATPAQPTQNPAPGDALPTFETDALGTPPLPAPETPDGDLLHPRLRRPDRLWVSADYTPVFIRSGPLQIPLVTSGPVLPNAADNPGALGQPGTAVLFGYQDLQWGRLDGIRGAAGIWFDTENHLGLEMRGTWVFQQHIRFAAGADGNGNPLLARPVFATNSRPGVPSGEVVSLVAFSPDQTGTIQIDAPTQFWDLEVNMRFQDYFSPVTRGSWLFGFRTARLDESILIQSSTTALLDGTGITYRKDTPLATGDRLLIEDSFQNVNQFYGLQLGGLWALDLDRFFVEMHGKAAVGVTHEQARIAGTTTFRPRVGIADTSVGGLLTQTSNIGVYNRFVLSFLPEAGINLGMNVMENLRIKGGYSGILWSRVMRPGQAIDRRVDLTQVPSSPDFQTDFPGSPAPLFSFRDQMLWLHVFNIGLEFHY